MQSTSSPSGRLLTPGFGETDERRKIEWLRLFALSITGIGIGLILVIFVGRLLPANNPVLTLASYIIIFGSIFFGLFRCWPANADLYAHGSVVVFAVAVIGALIQTLLTPNTAGSLIVYLALIIVPDFMLYAAYWLSSSRYTLACWLLISSSLPFIAYLSFIMLGQAPIVLTFFVPIALCLTFMGIRETWILTIALVVFAIAMYLVQDIFQIIPLTVRSLQSLGTSGILSTAVCVPVTIFIITVPARSQAIQLRKQNAQLQEALATITLRQQTNDTMSRDVYTLASALADTATEQTQGSQNQVSSLVQVSATLTELTQTARTIATTASDITDLASTVRTTTQHVTETAQTVAEASERGIHSVNQTLESNQRVNALYTNLTLLLMTLLERSREMKKVTSLIRTINDETHLLSLNAAIEAAGAGENGQRFAVVATAVKALTDRSSRASQEIGQILGQIETQIGNAVRAAENGKRETEAALLVAEESGTAIRTLGTIIDRTVNEVASIEQAIGTLHEFTRNIGTATTQQYAASTQATVAIERVTEIAQLNVTANTKVQDTTLHLETLAHNLALQSIGLENRVGAAVNVA